MVEGLVLLDTRAVGVAASTSSLDFALFSLSDLFPELLVLVLIVRVSLRVRLFPVLTSLTGGVSSISSIFAMSGTATCDRFFILLVAVVNGVLTFDLAGGETLTEDCDALAALLLRVVIGVICVATLRVEKEALFFLAEDLMGEATLGVSLTFDAILLERLAVFASSIGGV